MDYEYHESGIYDPSSEIKKKFCFVLFNRATYARVMALMDRLAATPNFEIHCALMGALLDKRFGKAKDYIIRSHEQVTFHDVLTDEYKANEHIFLAADILASFATFLAANKFDAVIVVGDRFETLPAAMAAAYQNIILIHIQGGEITGSLDERVRHAITKLSDYHFVATDLAKAYLLRMGEERYRVFNTGCPSLDPIKKWRIRRWKPTRGSKYIMCIFHPDTESPDVQFAQTVEVLRAVVEFCIRFKHVCYWYWPNPDPGREKIIEVIEDAHKKNKDILIKAVNQEPYDFFKELSGATFMVGNSSCGIRECSFIGVPAINIGKRQNWRERSWNVVDVDCVEAQYIVQAMITQAEAERFKNAYLYGRGTASDYIAAYLTKMNMTQKGPLNYPREFEFAQKHFGEARFNAHKNRHHGDPYNKVKRVQNKRSKRAFVQSESGGPEEDGTGAGPYPQAGGESGEACTT